MAHNYEEFPFPDFKHAIKSGKNTYRNKFFHDIDLSFLLKWMESVEGENYKIRIVDNVLQLIDGDGNVVSEVNLTEGQQGPPGITPNVQAAAFVNDGTGTPSVEVVKSGTTENPTFSFNFSNLKGETGATGPASTVPGPAGTPFQVKAQYDTYAEMISAHPTGQVGDAYQVGENPTPTINNSTITLTQGGVTKGSFTLNQADSATIDLDAGGSSDAPYVRLNTDFTWPININKVYSDDSYSTKVYDRSSGSSFTFENGKTYFVESKIINIPGTQKFYDPKVSGWVAYAARCNAQSENFGEVIYGDPTELPELNADFGRFYSIIPYPENVQSSDFEAGWSSPFKDNVSIMNINIKPIKPSDVAVNTLDTKITFAVRFSFEVTGSNNIAWTPDDSNDDFELHCPTSTVDYKYNYEYIEE